MLTYRYQFQLQGKAAAPVRDDWETAFEDARKAGYGVQIDASEHQLTGEAKIVRIK